MLPYVIYTCTTADCSILTINIPRDECERVLSASKFK